MVRRTIEGAGTFDFERKVDRRQLRIDAGRHRVVERIGHQTQGIQGEIAGLIDLHGQHAGGRAAPGDRIEHADTDDALSAFNPDVGRRQSQRAQRLHKMQFEFPLALSLRRRGVIDHFEKVDPFSVGWSRTT